MAMKGVAGGGDRQRPPGQPGDGGQPGQHHGDGDVREPGEQAFGDGDRCGLELLAGQAGQQDKPGGGAGAVPQPATAASTANGTNSVLPDIHVVCDNYGTHKTPAIKTWLARHPRIHLLFTPTGSSWINQVERWFGFLTDQLIRRGVHKSVQSLEHDIREWVSTWNEDPKPFVWEKTAEEILDSLARYLQRVTGQDARNQLMQRTSEAGH